VRFATGPEIFLCDLYIQVDCGVHATSYKMGNFSGQNEMNNTCRKTMHMEVMKKNFTVFCQYLKEQTCFLI